MTTDKFEITNIFSIFHDGIITQFYESETYCSLKIDCMYLAERVNKDFLHFLLKIYGLRDLSFKTWSRDVKQPSLIMTNPNLIFSAALDIFDSELIDDKIMVRVGQEDDKSLDFVGGDLTFDCSGVEILTPNMTEFKYQDLVSICKQYWDDFEKR